MRQEPAWRAEARRLKSEGLTQVEIAKRCGVTEALVSRLLGVHSATFFAPHTPHVAHRLIDQAAIPAAARAFAAHEIDRAELMRRITPA
jgi:predicted transcriptional regulator